MKQYTRCCVFFIDSGGNEGSVWWRPISEYENCIIDACELRELGMRAWVVRR